MTELLRVALQSFDLAAGGVDIAPSQDLIAPEVITAVDEVKEKIVSGEVVVPADKESFEAKYGRCISVRLILTVN